MYTHAHMRTCTYTHTHTSPFLYECTYLHLNIQGFPTWDFPLVYFLFFININLNIGSQIINIVLKKMLHIFYLRRQYLHFCDLFQVWLKSISNFQLFSHTCVYNISHPVNSISWDMLRHPSHNKNLYSFHFHHFRHFRALFMCACILDHKFCIIEFCASNNF